MQIKISPFIPITLGMLTAFGPFVTDVYLPAMPELADYYRTSAVAVGASLTAGMLGLASGQILIGPLSDKFGRKKLLLLSMALFVVASLLCVFSPNIQLFNLFRFFQGMSGAGGVVLSRSIATDMFRDKQLANFLALLGAINGVGTVFAPMLGGVLTKLAPWQGIFWVLTAIGVILLFCSMRLRETLAPQNRSSRPLPVVYAQLFGVFGNKRFTLSTLAMMFSFLAFFAYITASPFIFQQQYGLSAFEYSICFGLNAFCIGIGTWLPTRFHHANTALKWASIDLFGAACLVAVCQLMRVPLPILMPCYIYMLICFGMMQPVSTAIAMNAERSRAGAASAVFGAASFVAGAIASPLVTMGDVLLCSAAVIVAGSLCCMLLTLPLCNTLKREQMGKAAE